MSKSKYPNQIDTPSELPIVRDNIFEIGSDAINSLRSAIVQIEKTLGINPQGAVGLTVGDRISQSIDYSGNIKREALDRAGIISGPIFDDQISDAAAIKESKLKLNFPTQILQSEISTVATLIDEIQIQIEQIASKLSAHLSPEAANRHPATAISTKEIITVESDLGIKNISASNVQSVLDSVFSSHINYSGTDISELNNSHSAKQIYFNNLNTEAIDSSNVQGAIEEVSNLLQKDVIRHQDLLHSNGLSKTSYINDVVSSGYGTILINSVTSSIYKNIGEKNYFELIFDSSIPVQDISINIGDITELTINSLLKQYQVYKVIYDTLEENITGIYLFGILEENNSAVNTTVYSRIHTGTTESSLLCSARQRIGYLSSSIVQVINLDAPFLKSSGLNKNEISLSNRYFDLKINGTQYSFDVYDSSIIEQSIDSIVKMINETVDYLGLPILAYRIDNELGKSEIIISHNISALDVNDTSLELIRVDNSIDSLGLSAYESKIIHGRPGTSYYIDGSKYSGLLKKFDLAGFDIEESSLKINSGASGISFLDYGIKKGDIVNIIDLSVNSYEITDVTSSYISVSSRQLPTGFTTASVGTARLIIYESTTDLSNSEFLNVGVVTSSSEGSSLFEIFFDSSRRINYNLILEHEAAAYFDKSVYQVVDVKNNSKIQNSTINFENTTDNCTYVWLDNYKDRKKIVGNNNYIKLTSSKLELEIFIFVKEIEALFNYAGSLGGSFSKQIFINNNINKENNLILSNIHYSNFLGKVDGGINGSLSISKVNIGNLSEKDISTELRYNLTERPISELRSSGVISGLEVSVTSDPDGYTVGNYLVTVSDGVCYVAGRRFAVSGVINYDSGVSSATYDKVYVGIDYLGNLVFSNPNPSCSYPWAEEEILLLGTIENTGSYYNIIDQRLFINNLDLKLLNSITVSPQPGMGHFADIRDALKYAKRFSEIYTGAGTPEIHLKSGNYTITLNDSTSLTLADWFTDLAVQYSTSRVNYFNNIIQNGLFVDFPITIRGEGETSKIEVIYTLVASDQTVNLSCGFFVAGNYFNTTSGMSATKMHDRISSGTVSFNNFYIQEGWITLGDIGLINQNKFEINNIIFYDIVTITSSKAPFYFGSNPFFGIVLSEIDNSSYYKGNVSINGCSFVNNGNIRLYPDITPSRYKYISILNSFSSSSNGISTPLFSSISKFPSEHKVYSLSNITSSRTPYDRISSNILIGANAVVGGNCSVTGNTSLTGSLSATSVSATSIVSSGSISATSFLSSSPKGAIKAIPISDFYPIIQQSSSTYTYSNVSIQSVVSGIVDAPAILSLVGVNPYIFIPLDPYLANNATGFDVKVIGSMRFSTSIAFGLSLYSMSKTGTSSLSLINSKLTAVTTSGRVEKILSFGDTITNDNMYYLKISVPSTVSEDFYIYRILVVSDCNGDIEKMINVE